MEIQCPFCGSVFETYLDPGDRGSELTLDCENCCRPMRVVTSGSEGICEVYPD